MPIPQSVLRVSTNFSNLSGRKQTQKRDSVSLVTTSQLRPFAASSALNAADRTSICAIHMM